jgi:hypothetical protein
LIPTIAALLSFSIFGFGGDSVSFDRLKPGSFPPFWTSTANRANGSAKWEVLLDANAPSRPNVFVKTPNQAGESDFPMAIFDRITCRDGELSVKFKIATSARRIKTAGIVWRYQDPRNYYLLQFSVDEKNVALFRVQDGQVRPIPIKGGKAGAFGVPRDLRAGQWYAAKVLFHGSSIKVLFDNRQLFDATDDSLPSAGKTGLWTRGATEAAFDDFRIDRKG